MNIKVEEAQRICEKYGNDAINLVYLEDLFVKSRNGSLQLFHGMKFDSSQSEFFLNAGVKELEFVFDDRVLAKLAANFPSIYRLPVGRKNIIELDKLIDDLEAANATSKRKRSVISLTETYRKDSNGVMEPVLKYGEKLNPVRLNEIKGSFGRSTVIDYRFDEVGIIVFFLLNSNDPSYASKFMKFTDLISIIVESKNMGVTFSPDLNIDTDIYTVNDKDKLFDIYRDTKSSMVVIGEDISDDYKTALSEIKNYDKYAKMMIIKNIDTNNRVEIIGKIKEVYNQFLWMNI